MAREINIFNVSFLDLLSGALGAVLILFIVIPKLTSDIKLKLEQLEQLTVLKEDVAKIQSTMEKLKATTIDKALFQELQTRMDKLNSTIENLSAEVKDLQSKLAKCEDKRIKQKEKIETLEARVKELEDELKNNGSLVKQLKAELQKQKETFEKEINELKEQLAKCDQDKAKMQIDIEKITETVTQLGARKDDLETEVDGLKKELAQEKEKVIQLTQELAQYEEKTGFQFSDKNVVFVVDISGSMDDDPEPEKLNEVKAGIKMMIATMDNDYKVDVVIYPKNQDEFFGYHYGKLTPVNENTKYDIYNYLSSLRAAGCTPTKEVMEYVLDSPSYSDAGTIILLSDGLPTERTSYTECNELTDTSPIENFIKTKNGGKRVINCIGVGKDFRARSTSDPKVRFMKNVAKQNGGFYIGF